MSQVACRWCGATLWDVRATHLRWECSRCHGFTYNPKRLSFQGTAVSPQRTLGEIIKLFGKFNDLIGAYTIASDPQGKQSGIEFILRTRYSVEVPDPTDEDSGRTKQEWREGGMRMRFLLPIPLEGKEHAQKWRLVLNWLENTLEAIVSGALRAEDALLAYAVGTLPDGSEQTLGERVRSRLPSGEVTLPMFDVAIRPALALPGDE